MPNDPTNPFSGHRRAAVRSILIVEDDADTREMFVRAFKAADYRVLSAESVAGALRFLRAGERVDAVLADYALGDGTGAAMLHQAENEGLLDLEATAALICTGYTYVEPPPSVVVRHKPICPKRLAHEVSQMLSVEREVA